MSKHHYDYEDWVIVCEGPFGEIPVDLRLQRRPNQFLIWEWMIRRHIPRPSYYSPENPLSYDAPSYGGEGPMAARVTAKAAIRARVGRIVGSLRKPGELPRPVFILHEDGDVDLAYVHPDED